MVKCDDCGREMLKANGCNERKMWILIMEKGVYSNTDIHRRERVDDDDVGRDGRCGDCGAKPGHIHHFGCDLERCPKCGGQLISCDCGSRYKLPGTSQQLDRLHMAMHPMDKIRAKKPNTDPRLRGIL